MAYNLNTGRGAMTADGAIRARRMPGSIPFGIGKITDVYNGVCSEAGLESCVTADPNDVFFHIHHYKNVGDRMIQVTWPGRDGDETRLIEPGEEVDLRIPQMYIPEIRSINNGNSEA